MDSDMFIKFVLQNKIIQIEDFTLKSGRTSPYFFNSGLFYDGKMYSSLVSAYCTILKKHIDDFDMLFGPAYKGIGLVSAISLKLYEMTGRNFRFSYDRKEVKNHGEGGKIIGSALTGRVLLVDDVMTAGSTIKYTLDLLSHYPNSSLVGVALAFDRMEKIDLPEMQNIPIYSIANVKMLCEELGAQEGNRKNIDKINNYLQKFGR